MTTDRAKQLQKMFSYNELRNYTIELEKALSEIQEGRGAFNRDPLTHCGNTVENLIRIAKKALLLGGITCSQ